MDFQWDPVDQPTEPSATAAWSGRGLLQAVLSCAGWLLLIPVWWLAETPLLVGSFVGWGISWVALSFAVLVSIAAILIACVRRSFGVAVVSLSLAVAAFVIVSRHDSPAYSVDYRYRLHRAALAELAQDYRAGRLDGGLPAVPADLRSLCPSGFAYASPTELFVQLWENWRHESGTGLAYFADPPTEKSVVNTADGDQGYPRREVGDGWWWVE
ncbi:hypothetical protein [Actinoplanes sichuanensis]|uniref:DUF4129 domain-containing protein n=1 Tax=Actinoplanes sichuanensis TaxID=512349 RepID=A0ABW4AL80_9ACTN|nr:hypothetical protein [Actinoplanes sichuanensis]